MTDRVAIACAAVPGATEDVTRRALASFEEHRLMVPRAARYAARKDERVRERMKRAAIRQAMENERQARTVGMGPIAALLFWGAIRWAIWKLLDRLWDWWWDSRQQAAVSEAE